MDRIQLKRNAAVAQLYEDAIRNEGAIISSSGALINFSGKKTGRSPKDKRIVYEETSKDDIWWGSVNIKMDERQSPPLCPFLSCISYHPQTPLKSIASVPLIISTPATTSTSLMAMPEFVFIISPYSTGVSHLSILVGSQVPYQGSRHLRPSLPCPLYGTEFSYLFHDGRS